jgi:hypothetical protein
MTREEEFSLLLSTLDNLFKNENQIPEINTPGPRQPATSASWNNLNSSTNDAVMHVDTLSTEVNGAVNRYNSTYNQQKIGIGNSIHRLEQRLIDGILPTEVLEVRETFVSDSNMRIDSTADINTNTNNLTLGAGATSNLMESRVATAGMTLTMDWTEGQYKTYRGAGQYLGVSVDNYAALEMENNNFIPVGMDQIDVSDVDQAIKLFPDPNALLQSEQSVDIEQLIRIPSEEAAAGGTALTTYISTFMPGSYDITWPVLHFPIVGEAPPLIVKLSLTLGTPIDISVATIIQEAVDGELGTCSRVELISEGADRYITIIPDVPLSENIGVQIPIEKVSQITWVFRQDHSYDVATHCAVLRKIHGGDIENSTYSLIPFNPDLPEAYVIPQDELTSVLEQSYKEYRETWKHNRPGGTTSYTDPDTGITRYTSDAPIGKRDSQVVDIVPPPSPPPEPEPESIVLESNAPSNDRFSRPGGTTRYTDPETGITRTTGSRQRTRRTPTIILPPEEPPAGAASAAP